MRLVLTVRGADVLVLELCWPGMTEAAPAVTTVEASGGGQFDRAEPYGDPATQHGFGFALPAKGERRG